MSSSQNPGYAGDISPADAWAQVQAGEALLVDVRTPEEQKWVGRVPGAIPVPWLLLCRSGVRSVAAGKAATEAGYTNVWNILGGFEGPLDENRQRNRVAGWRFEGMPWEQG